MKVIRPALADRADLVRQSGAEAQLVARLERPHVVPLYAYWREPGAASLLEALVGFQRGEPTGDDHRALTGQRAATLLAW